MNIDLLRELCETPGVPGREHRVRKLIEAEIEGLFDEVRTDSMGSLIAVRRSRTDAEKPLKIMLLCHMDEIGFLVTHVSEKGWIHIDNVGGFDPRTLFARRVKVVTPNGDQLVFRHARRVAGQRCIDAKPDIGQDGEGGGAGTAQAHFFLGGEGDVDFAIMVGAALGKGADGFDAKPAGDAVVERL